MMSLIMLISTFWMCGLKSEKALHWNDTKPHHLNLWVFQTSTNYCLYVILCTSKHFEKHKQLHVGRDIPIQDGRGLSQALLSPVIHFSVVAPCRVYPGSHLYVMLLPAKWPWSLTFRPNWGTPGSSQWDNSKPRESTIIVYISWRDMEQLLEKTEFILIRKTLPYYPPHQILQLWAS